MEVLYTVSRIGYKSSSLQAPSGGFKCSVVCSKPQQPWSFKYVQDRLAGLSLPPGYTFNDGSCELAGAGQGAGQGVGLVGSEDMAMGRHGLLFITRFAHIIQ